MRSWVWLAGLVVASALGCGSGAGLPPTLGQGGSSGSSGSSGQAGRGGSSGGAGTTAVGGATGTAGAAGTAGKAGSGGATGGAGGAGPTGGSAGSGGSPGSGGASAGSPGHDGGTDASVVPCDPLAQTTCLANERCTWIATSPTAGYAACLPDGTISQGGACAAGPNGAATGFDDCKRGLACALGQCQPICKTSPDSCAAHFVCTNYSSVFYSNGSIVAGVCAPTCNPLTQARDYDGAPACGSPAPASPALGCFGKSVFTCSKVTYPSNKSDAPAAGPSSGGFFLNGCAPGYLPVLTAATGSTQQICVALCLPGPTSQSAPADAGGVIPSTCAAAGAAPPHECRYWWWLENTTLASFPDTFSNTIGFCLDYTKYTGDKSGAGTAPYPSCTTLSATAHTYDATLTDTQYWGCEPYPTPATTANAGP